jgi:hypothetical protein
MRQVTSKYGNMPTKISSADIQTAKNILANLIIIGFLAGKT